MIVLIEGYFAEALLVGKHCSSRKLRQMYRETKKLHVEPIDFPQVFCRMHNFYEIPFVENFDVDVVIDTDTSRIYYPSR